MGTAYWRRGVVAVVSAILIFEAGAIAPASSVFAAPRVDHAPAEGVPQAAPLAPPPATDTPDATSSVTCDDFERPDDPDSLGVGPLGWWQAWNPPGAAGIINGEASLIFANDGGPGTIRYVDMGSIDLPFEILIKHRMWMFPTPYQDNSPMDVFFGLSEVPGFGGVQPPGDYYVTRYYHIGPLDDGRWVDNYIRARVGDGTGWVPYYDPIEFDADYADGDQFFTRFRVWGDKVYIKHWYVGAPEPPAFFEATVINPADQPMRYLVLWQNSSHAILDPPLTPESEWRIDEVCLDTAPPPVLLSEEMPPGTDRNHHPNTETGGDPVNTYNGSFTYVHQDVSIVGRGPAIDFTRTYNSNDPRIGPMGPGWTHNYATRLVLADDSSGDMYLIGPQGRSDRYTLNPDGSFAPPDAIHTQLVANPDGTFTATHQDQSSWGFDVGGRLTTVRDRHGNTSTLTYGAGARLVSISDPAGRGSLSLGYTNGQLTSVTDWASPSRVVAYQHDASGRLWKVTDREGKTTTFGYDGTSHRLTTITDPLGHVAMTLTYDAEGRVQTQKDARGLVTGDVKTFNYVENPDQTRVTTITSPVTSFEPTFNPTVEDTYNAQGWITQRVTHPSSAETLVESYGYDTSGSRTSITDARGTTTDFCYDVDFTGAPISGSQGNLTRVIAPPPTSGANRPVTLTAYDAKNNPTQIVTPMGVPSGTSVSCSTNLSGINVNFATDFGYDASQTLLLSETARYTDPDLGPMTAVTEYEYGDAANPGLVTRVIPPRGNTGPSPDYTYATSFAYFTTGSKAGMLSSATDALGNATTFDYDAVGRLTSSVDPLGNASGGVPADHLTQYVYDKEDRPRFLKLPAPTPGGAQLVTETRYDEVGNPVVRIDASGQVTAYVYDERDALSQVTASPSAWTDPVSPPTDVITTEYAYDAAGNLTRMTRAAGDGGYERATDYEFDGRGLLRRETQYPAWPSTGGSLLTGTAYDPNGNRLTTTDPLGQTTSFAYDALNRLTGVDYSDPATADVTYAYDAGGNRASMTDGTGTTSYEVDEVGRLTTVTSPGPLTVGYRYDLDGNRTKLIYPDTTVVTYAWNKAGQLASLVDWASRSVTYAYAPDGLLRTATKPDGSVATNTYDNARRLVDILDTGPSAAVLDRFAYTLDAVGNVTSVADGALQPQFARPDSLTGSNGTWTGTYASIDETPASDADFLASPSGPTTSNYYEVSLSDVDEPHTLSGITVRYRYAKSGNNSGKATHLTVELRQGSTVIASQSHTNIPGVAGSGWQAGSFTLTTMQANAITDFTDLRLRFGPSSTGGGQSRKAQVSWAEVELASEGDPTTLISYSYDSLYRLTSVEDVGGTESYTYDPVGNRLTAGATAYTYDRADRMTTAGPASITVDANGNLTAKGADSFAFDQANRLTSASVGGTTETYTYDGDGTRFGRQVGADPAIRYVSDVAAGLPLTIDDGSHKYVYGVGPAYATSAGTVEIYHADRLGSVRALTDASGAVTATYGNDEWGVATASTGSSTQVLGYAGEPRDATGLTYLRARYYDPSLGRFLSRDQWAGVMGEPETVNRYCYVTNNPVRYTDPSGLGPQEDEGIDWKSVLEVTIKCGFASAVLTGELLLVATSGTAAGATIAAPNPVTAGVAAAAGSIAIYNYEFTRQSILWCFGGDIPTAPKVPSLPPNFPPSPPDR